MTAYYNEHDAYAAQWLRNLIRGGHIAPGDVDERSIEDVHPDDLKPYTQCHFFAGIGAWSLALRRAGWPDGRPVWTGSCPCQPFSTAGEGAGFDDPRHLWPSFAWLIQERRPPDLLGEQVAGKAVGPWIDLVHTDLEALGYAFGAVPFPAAGVGAPHIRDRLYWVANANGNGRNQRRISKPAAWNDGAERDGRIYRMGNASSQRLGVGVGVGVGGIPSGASTTVKRETVERAGLHLNNLANPQGIRLARERRPAANESAGRTPERGPVNGLWADADWLFCRDGKWRPVEPGTFPLATGAASRVGRLRAYGNAINVEAATQFIAAYLET